MFFMLLLQNVIELKNVSDHWMVVKEPYMQQLKVFLKEASHQELLPTVRRFVGANMFVLLVCLIVLQVLSWQHTTRLDGP